MKKSAIFSNVLPKEHTGEHLLNYFYHPYRFIEADNPNIDSRTGKKIKKGKTSNKASEKIKPDWRTETKYPIKPTALWRRFNNPDEIIGVSFGSTTKYVMADIDTGSPYHPRTDEVSYRAILGCLEDIGLVRSLTIQSSDSGGVHVYFFFEEEVGTFKGACAIQETLQQAGFKIGAGILEIFPNTKYYNQHYKGHRLPLQPESGSYVLDDDFNPMSDDIGYFLQLADFCAKGQDLDLFREASERCYQGVKFKRYGAGKSKKALKRFEEDLLGEIENGFTAAGQTNSLLLTIACYGVVFLGLDEDKGIEPLVDYIVNTITNLEGYYQHCSHQFEIERRARDVAKSSQNYYWAIGKPRKRAGSYKDNFGQVLENVVNGNEQAAANAMQRLEVALEAIKEKSQQSLEQIPEGITAFKALIIKYSKEAFGVGIGNATLCKKQYADVWKPLHKALLAAVVTTSIAAEASTLPVAATEIAPQEAIIEVIEEVEETPPKTPPEIAETRTNQGLFTPCKLEPKSEAPEAAENKGCSHLPYMKVFGSPDSQGAGFSERPHSENLTPEVNSQESDSFISKPYSKSPPKISPTAQNEHKQPLSIQPQAEQYAKFLRSTHPDWQRFEEERESAEYQQQAKSFFVEVRKVLKKKRAGSKQRAHSFPP